MSQHQSSPLGAAGMALSDDDRLFKLLNAAKTKKNTVPIGEFQHYLPLFTIPKTGAHIDITNDSTDQEVVAHEDFVESLRELSKEWSMRVSPYHEVLIVDDHNPEIIVETLAPVLTRVADLNDSNIDAAGEVLDTLMNNIGRSDGIRDTVTPAAEQVRAVLRSARNDEVVEETHKIFTKHVERIEGAHIDEEVVDAPVDVASAMKDAAWD